LTLFAARDSNYEAAHLIDGKKITETKFALFIYYMPSDRIDKYSLVLNAKNQNALL